MLKFLLIIILMFALLVFLLGFSFLRFLRDMFFGSSERNQRPKQQAKQRSRQRQTYSDPEPPKRKKVFTPEQGEYTDYEEVK